MLQVEKLFSHDVTTTQVGKMIAMLDVVADQVGMTSARPRGARPLARLALSHASRAPRR